MSIFVAGSVFFIYEIVFLVLTNLIIVLACFRTDA